jgi:putative glutamine amidotransferase
VSGAAGAREAPRATEGRPRIGITAWCRSLNTSVGLTPLYTVSRFYVAAVEAAGGIPVILPATDDDAVADVLAAVDGLVLTGGEDVDSARYAQDAHPEAQAPDRRRDAFEIAALDLADRQGLPVFCVCRGLQVLNVARGGSLVQHIPDVGGEHMRLDAWNDHVHRVSLDPASRVGSIFRTSCLDVNSLHHQGIERLGRGLRATGWAPEGFVEAAEDERPDRFLLGVQWHPENLFEDRPIHLAPFQALVEAARGFGQRPRS